MSFLDVEIYRKRQYRLCETVLFAEASSRSDQQQQYSEHLCLTKNE